VRGKTSSDALCTKRSSDDSGENANEKKSAAYIKEDLVRIRRAKKLRKKSEDSKSKFFEFTCRGDRVNLGATRRHGRAGWNGIFGCRDADCGEKVDRGEKHEYRKRN